MKITLHELKETIKSVVKEFNTPSGGLRRASGKPKYHIGKVEDENKELSAFEANEIFPGSVDAWCEIVPELWPEAPVHPDPISIRKATSFFKEGNKLTAAFKDMPQITLATWDNGKEDWIENDFTQENF